MTASRQAQPGLLGQVAVVTGANHGIGAATAVQLARLGADITAAYLRLPLVTDAQGSADPGSLMRARDGSEVAGAVSGMGRRCVTIEADLTDPASPGLIFDAAERLGPVSILVNNASGWRKDSFSAASADRLGRVNHPVTAESVNSQLLVDARGGALMIAEFAARYHQRRADWGRIVSLTSSGRDGFPGEVSYGAAKAALESFTLSAAKELADVGVSANVVHPPVTDTGWITPEVRQAVAASDHLCHIAQPQQVAAVIAWLCCDAASLVTGNIIRLR